MTTTHTPATTTIDGHPHTVMDLAAMERMAEGWIEYPDPAPGWATTRVDGRRVAARFEGAAS